MEELANAQSRAQLNLFPLFLSVFGGEAERQMSSYRSLVLTGS